MLMICLRRRYGLDQEDGSLATVANVRYLGFLISVDIAYFYYFSIFLREGSCAYCEVTECRR